MNMGSLIPDNSPLLVSGVVEDVLLELFTLDFTTSGWDGFSSTVFLEQNTIPNSPMMANVIDKDLNMYGKLLATSPS